MIIAVATGFYSIYHRVASGKSSHASHDHTSDQEVHELNRENLENFRGFLRNLMMHGAVGTALGGVCTLVGEPQNLLIADRAGWEFMEFVFRMAPITLPVFVMGLATCLIVERMRWFDYGFQLPEPVRYILVEYEAKQQKRRNNDDKAKLIVQAVAGIWLIIALAFHLAEVGIIGLTVIVFITALNGIIEEHQIGEAFKEALPFTALLVVFFAIVAMIQEQNLFAGIIGYGLSLDGTHQIGMFYLANGILSAISDNVFVATVYINEVFRALQAGTINREQFDLLAVAINTGTNIPSVATPNGQAAFLFLLTSSLAPIIRLSYGRMVWMALPYTITMTLVGLLAAYVVLEPATSFLYDINLIHHHSVTGNETGGPAHH